MTEKLIRLDIGGGIHPREGYLNVDILSCADIQVDFEWMQKGTLPFVDDSVGEVYSSHCFEHVIQYAGLLHEIVRVCRLGARVEIRVPHWAYSMSFIAGHKHAISEKQVSHWSEFPDVWWKDTIKTLKLVDTIRIPSENFQEAKGLFPHLTDDQIMRFVQDTCFELQFIFEVVPKFAGNESEHPIT